MKGVGTGIVGALAIGLALVGLLLGPLRAGPVEAVLEPVQVPVRADGSYEAVGGNAPLAGVCVLEPCTPTTRIDLRLRGLPPAPYEAILEGPGAAVPLGPLQQQGALHVLAVDWPEDHRDRTALTLHLAGWPLYAWPVREGTVALGGDVTMGFGLAAQSIHLDEIGAISVSTVAKAVLTPVPPEGWEYVARLEGPSVVHLGVASVDDEVAMLESRVERVRLHEQDRVTVLLRGVGSQGDGFPVWSAAL